MHTLTGHKKPIVKNKQKMNICLSNRTMDIEHHYFQNEQPSFMKEERKTISLYLRSQDPHFFIEEEARTNFNWIARTCPLGEKQLSQLWNVNP